MGGLFNAEVTEKIRQGLCVLLDESDELLEWTAVTIFGKQIGDDITESEEGELGILQKALARGVCDKQVGWEPVELVPPFLGGQCEGVAYQPYYSITYTNFVGTPNVSEAGFLSGSFTGKITGYSLITQQETFNTTRLSAVITTESGGGGTVVITSSLAYPEPNLVVNELSMRRIGGGASCGDPRPKLKKDTPPQLELDLEYEDENGVPQTINNSTFILGDVNISPNGDLSIGFNNSDLQLKGDINIFPQYGVSFKSPIDPTVIDGKRFNPQGEGTEELEEIFSESEDLEEIGEGSLPIIAVIVKSQRDGVTRNDFTEVPNGDAPSLIIPRIAWVAFKIRTGKETGWTAPIDVKVNDGYVICPSIDGAIAYSVEWSRAWKGKAYALRGKPLAELLKDT